MNNMYGQTNQVPVRQTNDQVYYTQSTYPINASYYTGNNDERLAGGFVFPFLLGGVTGAALAPAFWRPGYGYNRPVYYPPGPYPYPYPPRRWF